MSGSALKPAAELVEPEPLVEPLVLPVEPGRPEALPDIDPDALSVPVTSTRLPTLDADKSDELPSSM